MNHFGLGHGVDQARTKPPGEVREPCDAMGVNTPKVGLHNHPGHLTGISRRYPQFFQHAGHKLSQLLRIDHNGIVTHAHLQSPAKATAQLLQTIRFHREA